MTSTTERAIERSESQVPMGTSSPIVLSTEVKTSSIVITSEKGIENSKLVQSTTSKVITRSEQKIRKECLNEKSSICFFDIGL